MDRSLHLFLIVMLAGLTKSQITATYGNTLGDSACYSQYSDLSHSVSKISEDIEEIKKTLIMQSNDITKNESQYQLFYTKKNWIDADLSCYLLGGHLVSFEDLEELTAVSNMITQPCSDKSGFWTAGRDSGNDVWIWRNSGDPIKAELWHTSQPDDPASDCGHLWTEVFPYRIADNTCERTFCYICEV